MAIEVFNRYEKKYMLDEHTFRRLLERINDYMEPDKYNLNGQFYSICNIYYDTDDTNQFCCNHAVSGKQYFKMR